MKPDFYEILREHNVHSVFLNPKGIVEAMEKCFNMGEEKSEKKYDKLKKTFLNLLEECGNNSSDKKQMEENWKKSGGLL
jgi:hypothetical protein